MAHPAGQQDEQPSIAEPPACIGQIAQPAPELGIRRPAELIPDAGPIGGDDGAGPPLAHLGHRPKMSDSLALTAGPTIFFPEARAGQRRRASTPPAASSACRSRLRVPAAVWPDIPQIGFGPSPILLPFGSFGKVESSSLAKDGALFICPAVPSLKNTDFPIIKTHLSLSFHSNA